MVDVGLKEMEPPMFLYHGTSDRFFDSIMEKGLLKQNRLYVHLSSDLSTAKSVGKRHGGKTIVFRVLAHDMYEDGFKFYLSANNVWCTEEVPSFPCQYLQLVKE